jgi:hypothetical protein
MLTTDFSQPDATRGARSDRMSMLVPKKFRSSPILSLNPLFREKHNSKSGRPPQAYIMKVSWPIEGHPIASTKKLSILFCFYLFCPNFLFQTPILLSLHPDGGVRRSRWPCRPRTTLMRALPDGVPPGGAIQGDQREFAHHPEAGGQTATHHGQTTNPCSSPARPIRPPAQQIPRPCFRYTRTCSCNGSKTFDANSFVEC